MMFRRIASLSLPFALISFTACATAPLSNEQHVEKLRPRAAFDLRCAPEELNFMPLSDTDGHVMTYGVEGCEQRIVYTRRNEYSTQWQMDGMRFRSAEEGERRGFTGDLPDPELYEEDHEAASE